jgi:hypothetical protein
MPINRLLNDRARKPEEVARLNEAYEAALRGPHLVDRNDPITEMVAKKIIDIARDGLDDPAQISARAIRELGVKPPP